MRLTIINPTDKTLPLPKTLQITSHKQANFVKNKGDNNNKTMLVLGPITSTKIVALDSTGKEVHVRKTNLVL